MSLVEHASRSGVIWSGATPVRARPWPGQPQRAFLLIPGSHGPHTQLPEATTIQEWIRTLIDWRYTSVRTTAVAPLFADSFAAHGFTRVQNLSLLRLVHTRTQPIDLPRDIAPRTQHIGRAVRVLAPSRLRNILCLDAAAFGSEWRLDAASFVDALSATQHSRLFVSHRKGTLEGFVLVGRTGAHGFIQRLAVHPDARRCGVATRLVATALNWTISHNCSDTVVNTEVSNLAAHGVYQHFGFTDMEHGLFVMERQL